MSNTLSDFMRTVKGGAITCPSCGQKLSFQKPGTFHFHLSGLARQELNSSINDLRRWSAFIEELFKKINIFGANPSTANSPFERIREDKPSLGSDGKYSTLGSIEVAKFVAYNIDLGECEKIFGKFFRLKDFETILNIPLEERKEEIQKWLKRSQEVLLKGWDLPTLSGPLPQLILGQTFVANWMENVDQEDLNNLLEEVCPNFQKYLSNLLALDSKARDGRKNSSLEEAVLHTRFLLAILLGHNSRNHMDLLKPLGIDLKDHFKLPRQTKIQASLLRDLLCSSVVLDNSNFGFTPEFIELVKRSDLSDGPDKKNSDLSTRLASQCGEQIYKIVVPACAGSSSGMLADYEETSKASKDKLSEGIQAIDEGYFLEDAEFCNWTPKAEETQSIVVCGSPGCGKSVAVLAGFTEFLWAIAAIGGTVEFDSPEDEELANNLRTNFWAGKMPPPTKKGERNSIRMTISFTTEPYKPIHYVVIDVAGEVIAASLTRAGANDTILRILKQAQTMIIFWDFSIEPMVREQLIQGDSDDIWKDLAASYVAVNTTREGRSAVNQFQLMQKLISNVQEQKQSLDGLKGMNLIVAFPKSDLLADEDNQKQKFFTEFFKSMQKQQLLVPSRFYKGESFVGLRSNGGFGFKSQSNDPIARQKEIANIISQEALKCLAKVGDALGDEPQFEPLKIALNEMIRVRLVALAQQKFGKENVYFLPISAQGENSDSLDLGHPPNQKFAEYLFLLPVVLTAEKVEVGLKPAKS
jgi:hypothetical protein